MHIAGLRHLLIGLLLGALGMAHAAPAPFTFPLIPPQVLQFEHAEMAPLVPLAEWLGATATRDLQTGVVTLRLGEKSIVCTPDVTTAQANGQPVTLSLAPFMLGGVLYAPLQPCAEALGVTASVNNTLYEASVTLPAGGEARFPTCEATVTDNLTDPDTELYQLNLDGGALRRLTYDSIPDGLPARSPDGTMLVSMRDQRLFLRTTANPTGAFLLAMDPDETTLQGDPAISPDGTRILFTQTIDNKTMIVTIKPDGTDKRILTAGQNPCFSPDGATIAFNRWDKQKQTEVVWLMDGEGARQRAVSKGYQPIFSPDGTRLLCLRHDPLGGDDGLYLLVSLVLKGKNAGKMTTSPPSVTPLEVMAHDSFNPNGNKIVLVGEWSDIAAFSADATQQDTLSSGGEKVAFHPDGLRITYIDDGNLYLLDPGHGTLQRLTWACRVADYRFTSGNTILLTAVPDQAPLFR